MRGVFTRKLQEVVDLAQKGMSCSVFQLEILAMQSAHLPLQNLTPVANFTDKTKCITEF